MYSRSDVHKVSGLQSGTKGNLRIHLLNIKSHADMDQLMWSFYFLIVLRIQYRKVQEIQVFGMFWRQCFAGAGEAKEGALMHLLLTNKKNGWWMGRLIGILLYLWFNKFSEGNEESKWKHKKLFLVNAGFSLLRELLGWTLCHLALQGPKRPGWSFRTTSLKTPEHSVLYA